MSERKYTIDDLVRLTGLSRRTIRFYVQEGLVDPPAGRGRGGFYFDRHLEQIRRIRALQEQGLRLATIRRLLRQPESPAYRVAESAEERQAWTRIVIRPGLEIHVRYDVEVQHRGAIGELVRLARLLTQDGEGQHDRNRTR